jgi:hypothetical protein
MVHLPAFQTVCGTQPTSKKYYNTIAANFVILKTSQYTRNFTHGNTSILCNTNYTTTAKVSQNTALTNYYWMIYYTKYYIQYSHRYSILQPHTFMSPLVIVRFRGESPGVAVLPSSLVMRLPRIIGGVKPWITPCRNPWLFRILKLTCSILISRNEAPSSYRRGKALDHPLPKPLTFSNFEIDAFQSP